MNTINQQQILILTKPNKAYAKLMQLANKNASSFITGMPLSIIKYGRYDSGKLSFISFETTGGIEDTYSHEDCLAMAIQDSSKIITFNFKSH